MYESGRSTVYSLSLSIFTFLKVPFPMVNESDVFGPSFFFPQTCSKRNNLFSLFHIASILIKAYNIIPNNIKF
jgi:hypothetical protein